jgi:phenylalanyl-tRNA synthetase alpha chain
MNSAPALHPIERSILKALADNDSNANSLAANTGLSIDKVRRGIEWLKFKNLILVSESSILRVYIGPEGLAAIANGLPERRLVNAVKQGKSTIAEILASGAIKNEEVNAAIAGSRRNQWIRLDGGRMTTTASAEKLSAEETFLANLKAGTEAGRMNEEEMKIFEQLKKRPGYLELKEEKESRISLADSARALIPTLNDEQTERHLTAEMITTGRWRQMRFSALDVEAPAPAVYPGRQHPLVDIIEEVKEIFVGFGFSEIDGPIVQSGFWNFDALFTPQDHPAREMQDTFYISGHRQTIPATGEQKRKVADIHKKGWSSKWDIKEAERVVLRTHTTPVTLQHLASIKPEVGRYFFVGRVFRNEKMSYKHLVEFHQVEGVATAPHASLRDLMGLQKELYAKMGIKKVKFWPTFFPYTEPSLQSMIYSENLKKWIELFGMGIFRPEVTEPLGIKNPVLAWGGGLERIAMLRFGLDDVRELYGNRLAWLRSVPRCQL